MEFYRSHVLVCGGTGCHSSGSADIIAVFDRRSREKWSTKGS